jgi:phosphate/sulfate permease
VSASNSNRRISMKNFTAILLLLLSCTGCTVLSIAGTAVSTTVSVVGTVVETGVSVAGSAIKGVANAIAGPDEKPQQ